MTNDFIEDKALTTHNVKVSFHFYSAVKLKQYLEYLGGEGGDYFMTSLSPNLPNNQLIREGTEKSTIDWLWKILTHMMELFWMPLLVYGPENISCGTSTVDGSASPSLFFVFLCPQLCTPLSPPLFCWKPGLIYSVCCIFISNVAPYVLWKTFHPVHAEGITLLS